MLDQFPKRKEKQDSIQGKKILYRYLISVASYSTRLNMEN